MHWSFGLCCPVTPLMICYYFWQCLFKATGGGSHWADPRGVVCCPKMEVTKPFLEFQDSINPKLDTQLGQQ